MRLEVRECQNFAYEKLERLMYEDKSVLDGIVAIDVRE